MVTGINVKLKIPEAEVDTVLLLQLNHTLLPENVLVSPSSQSFIDII